MKKLLVILVIALLSVSSYSQNLLNLKIGDCVDGNYNPILSVSGIDYKYDKFNGHDVYTQYTYYSRVKTDITFNNNVLERLLIEFPLNGQDGSHVLNAFYKNLSKIEGSRNWIYKNNTYTHNSNGHTTIISLVNNSIFISKF